MKTFSVIFIVAAMFFGIQITNATEGKSSVNTEVSASYDYVRAITIYKFTSHAKTTGRAELYSSGSNYYVKRNGDFYRVFPSNHSDYEYMFSDRLGTWYFN